MRIRTIKPEFWRSDDIAALSIEDRLLFVGLWSYVDDTGIGEDKVSSICGDLFAPDMEEDAPGVFARVRRGLQELSDRGLIVRYTVAGKHYLAITNWKKHQRIDKPSNSRYPGPGQAEQPSEQAKQSEPATPREDSGNTPGVLREGSPPGTGEQGNRGTGEQRGDAASSSPPTRSDEHEGGGDGDTDPEAETTAAPKARQSASTREKRGTRIPDDFAVDASMVEWARQRVPHVDGRHETEKFINYWQAKTGKDATKRNWVATWKNWMLRAAEYGTSNGRAAGHNRHIDDSTPEQRAARNPFAGAVHSSKTEGDQ